MPFLQKLTKEYPPPFFRLQDGETTIGRSRQAHVNLQGKEISRVHAVIRCEGKKYFLANHSARKVTMLNRRILTIERRLRHGDIIMIGAEELLFLDIDELATGLTAPQVSPDVIVVPPTATDPDDSVPRGTRIIDPEVEETQRKIVASESMEVPPTGPSLMIEAAGKLSCVMRMINTLRRLQSQRQPDLLSKAWLAEFPQAVRFLLVQSAGTDTRDFTVTLSSGQDEFETLICPTLIRRAFVTREATLAWDLWSRHDPISMGAKASTRYQKVSVLTVPIPTLGDDYGAAIQLVTGTSRDRFTRFDLDRLILLGTVSFFIIPLVQELLSHAGSGKPADSQP